MMRELRVEAKTSELNKVQEFAAQMLKELKADENTCFQVKLSLEEVFVNIASYAYPEGEGMVTLECGKDPEDPVFILRLTDTGVPFDPLEKEDPETTEDWILEHTGGMGIHLTKTMMDSVEYRYTEGKNELTLRKRYQPDQEQAEPSGTESAGAIVFEELMTDRKELDDQTKETIVYEELTAGLEDRQKEGQEAVLFEELPASGKDEEDETEDITQNTIARDQSSEEASSEDPEAASSREKKEEGYPGQKASEDTAGKKKKSLRKRIILACVLLSAGGILSFGIIAFNLLMNFVGLAGAIYHSQAEVIRETSQETTMNLATEAIRTLSLNAASRYDGEFWTMRHDFYILAEQVRDVFEHPENYGEVDVYPPSKANGGRYVMQLLLADESVKENEEEMGMVRRLANLGPMMAEIVNGNKNYMLDCYIALPNGVTMAMDALSDRKFLDTGELRPYDPRERAWYQGAVETGDIYFTPAVHSHFYDLEEVVFGVPVYKDGELVAVLEGSTKLDNLQKFVAEMNFGENGFSVLITKEGQLVYSPRDTGDLAMEDMISTDIFASYNGELKNLVRRAMKGESGFDELTIDSEEYYAAYDPVESVGWIQMTFVPKEDLERPTELLLKDLDQQFDKTLEEQGGFFDRDLGIMIAVLFILMAVTIAVAIHLADSMTRPIHEITEQVRNFDEEHLVFEMDDSYRTGDEIEVLAKAFEALSERIRLYIEEVFKMSRERENVAAELAMAASIQSGMLPVIFPAFPDREDFDVYAIMNPAREVGGDFYDFFLVDDFHICVLVGDVSGKGVPAAMFMAISKALIKDQILQAIPLSEAANRVNQTLCENNEAGLFVTSWMGVLDLRTGVMTYVDAGHNAPILHRKNGKCEFLDSKKCVPLAFLDDFRYKSTTIQLHPGDRLFLYTDGATEARNPEREFFGDGRLLSVLEKAVEKKPQMILTETLQALNGFMNGEPQYDDITMLLLDYEKMYGNRFRGEKIFPAKEENWTEANQFIRNALLQAKCPEKAMGKLTEAVKLLWDFVREKVYQNESDGEFGIKLLADEKEREVTLTGTWWGEDQDPFPEGDGAAALVEDYMHVYKDGANRCILTETYGEEANECFSHR